MAKCAGSTPVLGNFGGGNILITLGNEFLSGSAFTWFVTIYKQREKEKERKRERDIWNSGNSATDLVICREVPSVERRSQQETTRLGYTEDWDRGADKRVRGRQGAELRLKR